MTTNVCKRKPVSDEYREKRKEISRSFWASLSEERKQEIKEKISKSLTGVKHSEERRQKNANAQKGQKHTPEHIKKQSDGLKKAYAEGRRQPVKSSHRKGMKHTEEAKAKIREARKHQVVWNKGLKTGPMPRWIVEKRAIAQTGKPHTITPAVLEGREKQRLKITGRKMTLEAKQKHSDALKRAYAEGRKIVSPKAGYGKGCYYDSPFQGEIWLRSTSELQRAQELDKEGVVWFYEIARFSVNLNSTKTTYRPDIWIVPSLKQNEIDQKNAFQVLSQLPCDKIIIEDVKGWWKPTHKTYPKITAFQEQYPEINFKIVVREGFAKQKGVSQ